MGRHFARGVSRRGRFEVALRKAAATFLFASIGVLGTSSVLGVDASTWELALGTGAGAVLNLVYRWSESELSDGE